MKKGDEKNSKEEKVHHSNNFGLASVILSIVGLGISNLYGVVFGIIGFIFAFKQERIERNVWSKWGKILAVLSIILGIILFYTTLKYGVDFLGDQ